MIKILKLNYIEESIVITPPFASLHEKSGKAKLVFSKTVLIYRTTFFHLRTKKDLLHKSSIFNKMIFNTDLILKLLFTPFFLIFRRISF